MISLSQEFLERIELMDRILSIVKSDVERLERLVDRLADLEKLEMRLHWIEKKS